MSINYKILEVFPTKKVTFFKKNRRNLIKCVIYCRN